MFVKYSKLMNCKIICEIEKYIYICGDFQKPLRLKVKIVEQKH